MVVFERLRKSKTRIVSRTPHEDSMISEQDTANQSYRPPVLRNFSYPTSIGSSTQIPSYPPAPRADRTTWDQLGEICDFSPDNVGKAQTTAVDEPFFYRRDRESYIPLTDQDSVSSTSTQSNQIPDGQHSKKHEPQPRKKQRRSTLLNLSSLYAKNKSVTPEDDGTCDRKDKSHKALKNLSFGDRIFSQRNSVMTGLKRNSLGQSKEASRFSISSMVSQGRGSPERPTSSSGVPIIDTRLNHPNSVPQSRLPLAVHRRTNTQVSVKNNIEQLFHPESSRYQFPKMDPFRRRSAPQGKFGFDTAYTANELGGSYTKTTTAANDSSKYGKSNWISQLKEWVSASEPSAQALKRHKRATYKNAGIAIDDPRASAKLHLPMGTLPPDAIQPSGWGPDPEEVVMKKTEQRKKLRQSYNSSMTTSRGSRSSSSQRSLSSSIAISSVGEEIDC